MHFHICPQEIAMIVLIFEHIQMYAYHYAHLAKTFFFNKKKPDDCEVCE